MDRELLLFAGAGNASREDLPVAFDHFAPALYRYAFFLCNNAAMADQIVGEVFARLAGEILTGRVSRLNLRPHLYKLAHHLLMEETLYTGFPAALEPADWRFAGIDPEDRLYFESIEQSLREDLTDDQRHVIVLRFIAGFSVKETAAITGKTVGNVKVIQNRAIAALRKSLGYQEVETRAITVLIMRMSQA